jgi:uncharacterized peroxidase-related enzyme
MSEPTKKIDLIEDADASGEVAKVYDEWRAKSGRQQMPGILKCFSHRPDFLREVMRFSDTVHFSAGHLDRRTKEAIASWVSWLNRCPYWLDSHAYFLRVQGANEKTVQAIAQGNLDEAGLSDAERALLDYVKKVTEAAYRTTPEDVDVLRTHGWTEPQIAEAVYITAMFAFFNRVADAFGIAPQGYLELNAVTKWAQRDADEGTYQGLVEQRAPPA